jgi:hypothetical protein
MFFQYDTQGNEKHTGEEESQWWARQLERYLTAYSERRDAYLDRRVVGNLTATVAGIVQTRAELTTSEVGSAITGPGHAEAGTQRLQRALHQEGWKAGVIEAVLWEQAEQRRQEWESRGETKLCSWDSSVLEKPASEHLEGWGAVRSSRVRRLARSRKGVFNVGTRERSRGPTTPTAREEAFQGRTTVGRQGAPWCRIAGTAPVPGSPASACAVWCGSPERPQAARRRRGRAQSLGDRPGQTLLGNTGQTAVG